MATIFHLIRHGDYPPLGRVLAGRLPGLSLSAEGREQAERVADCLARHPLACVATSPRERTCETAAPIAARHGIAPVLDPDLDEIDFGDWTGAAFADLHGDPGWQAFNAARGFAAIPGGETIIAVQARAVAAMLRLRAAYPGAELAVVSHADVIKAMLLHVLGAPLELMRRIEIGPASRSVVAFVGAEAQVRSLNLPPGG